MVEDDDFGSFSEEEMFVAAMQNKVMMAAWAFLGAFIRDHDLVQAWGVMSPAMRESWARWWVEANDTALKQHGFEAGNVIEGLVSEGHEHQLWEDFERVALRDRRQELAGLEFEDLGIGTNPRVIGPHLEVLYVHPQLPEGGVWEPGREAMVFPLTMLFDNGRWWVDAYGSEEPSTV